MRTIAARTASAATTDKPNPTPSPTTIGTRLSYITSLMMVEAVAPMAIRMPISVLLVATIENPTRFEDRVTGVQIDASGASRGDARGVTHGLRAKHLATGLVAGQMALAVVLLAGAGVLVRSVRAIVGAESGVRDPANVLVGLVRLPSVSYSATNARRADFDRLEAPLQAIPGIANATVASKAPMKGARLRPIEIDGRPTPANQCGSWPSCSTTSAFRVSNRPPGGSSRQERTAKKQ